MYDLHRLKAAESASTYDIHIEKAAEIKKCLKAATNTNVIPALSASNAVNKRFLCIKMGFYSFSGRFLSS